MSDGKRWVFTLFLGVVLWPIVVTAQATSVSKLAWDESAPDLATAQAYTYKYYPDGATVGMALTGVVCTGTMSPFQCAVAFPAFTPGNHSVVLSATNVAGESMKSSPFAFVFVVVPAAPANLRIQ